MRTILHMLNYHQFPQEGISHSLITWLNGKVDYMLFPCTCTRSCLFCTECGHWRAGLHCLLRHGKQRVVTPADFVAPKATGGIIHHLTTVAYLIYHAMWSVLSLAFLQTVKWWKPVWSWVLFESKTVYVFVMYWIQWYRLSMIITRFHLYLEV